MGVIGWKKPEALRPANVAAAVTAPGRAAVGWVQETLVPPGPPLAVEEAQSLVLRWQATKASALGAILPLPHHLHTSSIRSAVDPGAAHLYAIQHDAGYLGKQQQWRALTACESWQAPCLQFLYAAPVVCSW